MRIRHFLLLALLILAIACSPSRKSTFGSGLGANFPSSTPKPTDDGLSYQTAIVITEKSETQGVHAEYAWIDNHYSNYKVNGQALVTNDKKPYDIITITLSNNTELKLYFDISNFFGRF